MPTTNKAGVEKGGGHFTVSGLYALSTNRALIGIREVNKQKDAPKDQVKTSARDH
ncbi:MAG: hypothetical protein NDJ89_15795 [Oligoflexia bacterium]|nr:hypothetical protein [Oligoflexia bacterium]